MDVFSLAGKIVIDYSDAVNGLEEVSKKASATESSLNDIDDAATDAGKGLDGLGDSADDASDGLGDVGNAAGDAGDSADKADGQFTTWKATLANLAAQAITALIDKCTELAGTIIDLGVDTETAFAKLETIAGTENIDALSESISELSKETGVSSAELADVAYNAISAGSSVEDAMDMVTAATKLGVAGFTDADSALSVLSTAMNSYGDSAGTVAEISDSLIQVQNLGVTTIDELSTSMGKAIATGSAYSVNLGNLESAYVSITKAGISTEEATTYLNSMMNELGDSGSDVSAILQEKTGKSFTQLMEDGYSLGDVLGILYDACGDDSTALMNLWSSAEAGKASNAIVNQGLDEFNENLNTISDSSGATESAYSTMADTMGTKISIMKASFADLGLKIFNGLEGPLTSAINFITNSVIPWLEKLIENFDKIAPVIAAVTAAFVAYKAAMGISSIVSGVTNAITALNTAMSANPIMIVVSLITALVTALMTLWSTNEDFRNAVTAAWEAIQEVFSTIIEAVKAIISGFIEALSASWETIKTGVTTAFEAIKNVFITVWNSIKTVVTTAVNAIKTVITTVFNAIKTAISTVLNGIKNVFTTVWNAIKTSVTTVVNAIKNVVTTVFNAVKNTVSNVFNGIKTAISNGLNAAKNTVTSVLDGIKNKFTGIFDTVKNTVKGAIDKIKGFFKFDVSLPKIKLPHFGITPSGWKISDLLKGSIPKLGIEWYAKAMDDGMVMTSPTVFGYNSGTGSLLAGGEAGSETVVGTNSLMSMIQSAVDSRDAGLQQILSDILDVLKEYVQSAGGDTVIPVYIGNERLDELIINSKQRLAKRSGGMTYA